jgi:lipopolysaccharide/colanic/teichoic acid biosynthesis glycosyltransferase
VKTTMLVTLLIGIFARFMGEELRAWSVWLHQSIRRIAVAKLPTPLRERYEEEWESGVQDFPGEIFKLFYSMGLLRAAFEIHKAAHEEAVHHETPFGPVKRLFDVLFSAALIFTVSPCLLIIVVAIKVESAGPLFFLSRRIGKNGRIFHIARFRTVRQDNGVQLTTIRMHGWRDDEFESGHHPRVTRVGRFLRRHSLDELPILFSILRGDMSLVGPRPLLSSEEADNDLSHRRRFDLSPGLTGLWVLQRGHDRRFITSRALDDIYAEKWSVWLDFKILVRTMALTLTERD